MARYFGDYFSDIGRVFPRSALSVYFVNVTTGTRGERENTRFEEDADLLPAVYLTAVSPQESKAAYCVPPQSMRYALLWTGPARYLHVDLPFLPSSGEFNSFFQSLKNSPPDGLLTVGLEGEDIPRQWLSVYV
jgi:hypothetical protein